MDDFVIREWTLTQPGQQAPVHVHHGSDEAFYVLDGTVEFLVGTERRQVGAGTLVEVPKGTPHTFATVEGEPARLLIIMTAEIDALVTALHQPGADASTWARHRSEVVEDSSGVPTP